MCTRHDVGNQAAAVRLLLFLALVDRETSRLNAFARVTLPCIANRFNHCACILIVGCGAQHVCRASDELAIDSLLVTDGLFRSR